jgi:hypothetical protein
VQKLAVGFQARHKDGPAHLSSSFSGAAGDAAPWRPANLGSGCPNRSGTDTRTYRDPLPGDWFVRAVGS